MLATEYVWAEKVLDTVKDKAKQASEVAKRSILRRKPKDAVEAPALADVEVDDLPG